MIFTLSSFNKTSRLFLPHLKSKHNFIPILLTVFIMAVDIAVSNTLPFYSKYIVDNLIAQHSGSATQTAHSLFYLSSFLFIPIAFLGFLITCDKILSHIQDIVFFPVINRCIRDTTHNLINHLHTIPYLAYQTLNLPEIMNAMRRVSQSARAYLKIVCLMIIPSTIKLIIFCYFISKWGFYGYGLIITILGALYVLYKGIQWYTKIRAEAWNLSDKVMMRTNDSLLNTQLTRFFSPHESINIKNLLNMEAKLWHKTNTRLHAIHVLMGIILGLGITGILFTALQGVINNTVTVGDFVKLQGQLIAVFVPLKAVAVDMRLLAESLIDIHKIINLFNIKTTSPLYLNLNKTNLTDRDIVLQLSNVAFYRDNQPLLRQLNLTIYHGDKILIQGKSGAGKSTLIYLMTGLYQPTKGKITGSIISDQSTFSYVPQDLYLFNDSIRYNLCYGLTNFSDGALLSALEKVDLKTKILSLPLKLDSPVGDLGQFLSNGEIQRIALARALLTKSQCLILDETTHSIDSGCERKILKHLFEAIPTIIMISHRVSTQHYASRILTLVDGYLIEENIKQESFANSI